MKTFITSDWHFGEHRFHLLQRPFSSAQEHVDFIIRRHNECVHPDDEVIVDGDVIYKDADVSAWLPAVGEMHGRKTLIRGNHDAGITDDEFAPYFEKIIPEGDGIEFDAGIPCYITHYPTQSRADRFNLVGHIHSAFKYQLNMLNVGVDVHHFYPVDADKILFYYGAICDFYDDDVWVAYHPANHTWVGKRGKPGRYFQPE